MAPEVVLGRSYNQSVDVYSFSILVWQIVTGKVSRSEKKNLFVIEMLRFPLQTWARSSTLTAL